MNTIRELKLKCELAAGNGFENIELQGLYHQLKRKDPEM